MRRSTCFRSSLRPSSRCRWKRLGSRRRTSRPSSRGPSSAPSAEQLPPGTRPAVSPLSSALTTILAIGMRGSSPLVLRDLAEWTIRPRLLAVPGVANVVIYGGGIRQVQVTTTPERLLAAHATLDDLATAVGAADAPGGSGFLDRSGQRLAAWLDGR